MLDEQDILEDLFQTTSKKKKEFYRQCILIVKTYDSAFLHKEKKVLDKAIRIYMNRRINSVNILKNLNSGLNLIKQASKLYADELKEARRKLRGINYILDYGKGKKTSKCPTKPFRRSFK